MEEIHEYYKLKMKILADYFEEKDISKIKFVDRNLFKYKRNKYLVLQYDEAYKETAKRLKKDLNERVYKKIPEEYHEYINEDQLYYDILQDSFSNYLDKDQEVRIQDYNKTRFYIFKQ